MAEARRVEQDDTLGDLHSTEAEVPWADSTVVEEIEAIGSFSVIRLLGEGGMGKVYLARQQEPIRRVVALKVVKAGRHSAKAAARFETERQVLALMRHPAIAQVYDAGTTPRGNPYFVMEYVSGSPIHEFCDRGRLALRQRLELFVEVCGAIQHAHQRGVIHRDIKPENVLVSLQDGRPAPKVIDFGIAKAIAEDLDLQGSLTEQGFVVGTPTYMSPEQSDRALSDDVDTRTDVYSLGVLLYQLLVGTLPLQLTSVARFAERIQKEDPVPPSRRVRELESGEAAFQRGTDAAGLHRQLTGDLDWIVMKALEKNRSHRYASVSELAADVGRHLHDEPVLAGPPTLSYRVRKYIRRNRVATAAAAVVLLGLVIGSAGVSVGLVRSLRAEERARQEAEKARAINEFLNGMLAAPNPSRAGREVRVAEVLDRAAQDLKGRFAKEPEVEAAVRATLGLTYMKLGEMDKAGPHLAKALDLRERVLGPDHPETIDSLGTLANFQAETGDATKARELAERLVASLRRTQGDESSDTLRGQNLLARVLVAQGKPAEAEALARRTVEAQTRLLGEQHPLTLSTVNTLAGALWFQGKLGELEPMMQKTLEIKTRLLGPEHPEVLDLMNNLAQVLVGLNRTGEAETLARSTLEIRRRVLGPDHPRTLDSMTVLAGALEPQGRSAEAAALYRQVWEGKKKALGENHPETQEALRLAQGIKAAS
jgi:non-specific serine/threonine protein kinase/serine/threonine-protein kinase